MNAQAESIVAAIRELASEDIKAREAARNRLAEAGPESTWHLIQALHPTPIKARREVLKLLAKRADADATDVFMELLEDEDSATRHLAAEGLAALEEVGLDRILATLEEFPKNEHLQRGTLHVLHELRHGRLIEVVRPVLDAFSGPVPEIDVPLAALEARNMRRQIKRTKG